MTSDTPALQALRALGLEPEVLSHGPGSGLVEVAHGRSRAPAGLDADAALRAIFARIADTSDPEG